MALKTQKLALEDHLPTATVLRATIHTAEILFMLQWEVFLEDAIEADCGGTLTFCTEQLASDVIVRAPTIETNTSRTTKVIVVLCGHTSDDCEARATFSSAL